MDPLVRCPIGLGKRIASGAVRQKVRFSGGQVMGRGVAPRAVRSWVMSVISPC